MSDDHYKTLTETATAIAEGRLTSTQITTMLLERIEALDPKLHAFYTLLADEALSRAAELDKAQSTDGELGPLHGVPIAVKDLCHKRGAPTTGGHSFLRDSISTEDATVVARLEAAGAVIVGKLATTEGAMTGYHRNFKVPRNPWGDLDRWPGVSSGGSGVATAAGLCFGSLGTDTGGSIRWPSAVNGVVGLKPTWGRVSRHNVLDLAPTLDHIGPMTRSVRDAARMLSIIAGYDPLDVTSLSAPVPDYEAELAHGVAGLKIGWDEAYATDGVEPYVAAATRAAVDQLADQGAEIVEVTISSLTEAESGIWMTLAATEAAAVHRGTYPACAAEYGEFFSQFLALGNATSSVDLAQAQILRRKAVGRLAPVFNDIDLLVMPTIAEASFRYDPDDAYTGISEAGDSFSGFPFEWSVRNGRFVAVWDLNGYPTLSVPGGFSPEGMPISIQFVGAPLSEALLCRAGHAFESANTFCREHPPL